MQRFLLFDGGCQICSEAVSDIEMIAKGWLTVKSLNDPEIRALLDTHVPDWKFRPMLVEVDDHRVRVKTGFSMSSALLFGLGPVRSQRVLSRAVRAVQEKNAPARRSVLSGIGATAVLLGIGTFVGVNAGAAEASQSLTGTALKNVLKQANAKPAMQKARAAVRKKGYDLEKTEAVATQAEDGGYVVFLFVAHAKRPETDAAVISMEFGGKDEGTSIEYVSGSPEALFANETVRADTLKVQSGASELGIVQPFGAKEYISCLTFCVGANCASKAIKCRGLIFMYAVLACMVAVCGSKVNTCHKVCKSKW